MAYREIPHDDRVKAVREYGESKKLKETATKYGISEATILDDYKYILEQADEMLKKKRFINNKKKNAKVIPFISPKQKNNQVEDKHPKCPQCGSNEVAKNGRYPAINYLMLMMVQIFSFLTLNTEHMVQKYRCKKCRASYYSNEQKNNIFMKLWLNYVIAKLIVDLRFHQGASVRAISEINHNIFGMYSSTGYINNLCFKVSVNAKNRMETLKVCKQKNAKVMMYDETFPKSKEDGSTNMGVVNDENGLIRGIGIVKNKKVDTEAIMKKVLSDKYNPLYFLSDYDTTYPVVIKKLLPEIEINKDFVHTVRQIFKDCKTSINRLKVSESTLKHFTKSDQKRIIDLKKKLMRKQLNKVIRTIIKGFKKQYVSVGTLYIEGGLTNLANLCKKFPSMDLLFNKLKKFITKYLECWNKQMIAYSEKSIPLTSNITESYASG